MHSVILGVLAILSCVCFYTIKGGKKKLNQITWIIYSFLFVISFYLFVSTLINAIVTPKVWDFAAFYLYGKAAATGHNFYLPNDFQIVFNSLHLPFSNFYGFIEEVVNVGFPYPPPTILYFIPLGFLPYHVALILWTIFILLFLLGCIYLVYDQFFKENKLNGLMLVTILFFIFSPVRETISFSQTNFILLYLLLLMKKYSETKFAGIFLALALFTKPYMIIFILIFIIRKNWKAIICFILSSITLVGLTLALFGIEPFMSYLFNNPVHRLPGAVFSEDTNQSLHAVLLRSNLISINNIFVYRYISIGVLFVTFAYLFFLLRRNLYDYIWAVLLLVGLILYPGTLSYYGVLLLFIIFQLFDERKQIGVQKYLIIPIIGTLYCLSTISLFSSLCFLLSLIVLKSFKALPNYSPYIDSLETST